MSKTDIEAMRASNRAPTEKVADLIQRIEANEQDVVDKRMANMASMKPLYGIREELYAEAKDNGIHTKALKEIVKHRLALKKLVLAAQKMDDVTGDEYEHMRDQMDLFGAVPLSNGVQEAHEAEKADLQKQIDDLKAAISKAEDGTAFDGDEAEGEEIEEQVVEKPRLQAVK